MIYSRMFRTSWISLVTSARKAKDKCLLMHFNSSLEQDRKIEIANKTLTNQACLQVNQETGHIFYKLKFLQSSVCWNHQGWNSSTRRITMKALLSTCLMQSQMIQSLKNSDKSRIMKIYQLKRQIEYRWPSRLSSTSHCYTRIGLTKDTIGKDLEATNADSNNKVGWIAIAAATAVIKIDGSEIPILIKYVNSSPWG